MAGLCRGCAETLHQRDRKTQELPALYPLAGSRNQKTCGPTAAGKTRSRTVVAAAHEPIGAAPKQFTITGTVGFDCSREEDHLGTFGSRIAPISVSSSSESFQYADFTLL